MRCQACWREARRMAKRADVPDEAMNRITKRIYLQHHIAQYPLGLLDPSAGHLLQMEQASCSRHIKEGGYRRHKNGKTIIPTAKSRS